LDRIFLTAICFFEKIFGQQLLIFWLRDLLVQLLEVGYDDALRLVLLVHSQVALGCCWCHGVSNQKFVDLAVLLGRICVFEKYKFVTGHWTDDRIKSCSWLGKVNRRRISYLKSKVESWFLGEACSPNLGREIGVLKHKVSDLALIVSPLSVLVLL
jgi:hypothetical protein